MAVVLLQDYFDTLRRRTLAKIECFAGKYEIQQ